MVKNLKEAVNIPIVLFPGNITGVVPQADAILFSSLMNSETPTTFSGTGPWCSKCTQIWSRTSPNSLFGNRRRNICLVCRLSKRNSFDKPKIAVAYSLAAQFFGMRFVYLEAGSGAKTNVTPEMVATVRKVFQGFLIVGGGIRDAQTAKSLTDAGADAW